MAGQVWTEDVCTCGHDASSHEGSIGKCTGCAEDAHWGRGRPVVLCGRYQWNQVPRRRIW